MTLSRAGVLWWFAWSLLSTLGWTLASSASAQERPSPPRLGDKVFVDFTHEVQGLEAPIRRTRQRIGRLVEMDSTTWRLESKNLFWAAGTVQSTRIPLADLERVRVHEGRSGTRGMWRGLAWGAAAGVLLAVVAGVDADRHLFDASNHADRGVWFIPAGLGAGAVAGGVVGADVWRDFPVSQVLADAGATHP